MKAKLRIREMGSTLFVELHDNFRSEVAADRAGERMTKNGSVEEYEVWTLVKHKRRHWAVGDVK